MALSLEANAVSIESKDCDFFLERLISAINFNAKCSKTFGKKMFRVMLTTKNTGVRWWSSGKRAHLQL